jgi:acetyl-CoA synthetase
MAWLAERAGGKPVIEYCGGTETGGSYITSTVLDPAPPGCFSAKTLGSDFVILDEAGRVSDTGEVFLIPPVLGHSTRLLNADHHEVYFEGCPPGPAGQVLRRHGDMVERMPGGRYRALGRSDDSMNLGGIKVSPVELEQVMNACAGVAETAAIAVSPKGGGPSELVVFAVLDDPDAGPDVDGIRGDLQERIREHLNPLFRISDLRTIDALPRTASNKVMRRVLRDRYRGG